MLLLKIKKVHMSIAYPPEAFGRWHKFDYAFKGPAFKKRDRCGFVRETGNAVLEMFLQQKPDSEILEYFQGVVKQFCSKHPTTPEELEPYMISCKLGMEYKDDKAVALHVARQMEAETGGKILPGRRLSYVVVRLDDVALRYLHAKSVEGCLKEGNLLDTTFYLHKQLLPPLDQLFGLYAPLLYAQMNRIVESRAIQLELTLHEKHRNVFRVAKR